MTATRFITVVEDGQLPLPEELQQRLGLSKGNQIMVTETDEGVLISTRAQLMERALADLEAALADQDIDLEEMIESGRELRADIVKELYGIELRDDDNAHLR